MEKFSRAYNALTYQNIFFRNFLCYAEKKLEIVLK
jgi:hypothetical protein